MAGRLDGKVAIVTGAGAGIGEAAAVRFAAEGARVVCVDRDRAAADATCRSVSEAGGEAIAIGADVGSPGDMTSMAEATLSAFSTIDVLYANAGIAGVGTAADCDLDEWDRVIRVNLTGVWLSLRAVLPTMIAHNSGSCILQSSVGGVVGVPGIFPYAAAKAGVIGMARQAAADFGHLGIRINAIAPGTARTALVDAVYATGGGTGGDGAAGADEEHILAGLARAAERYPMKRLGTVEDIANMALFLASDEAGWITGAVHTVDGGLTAV